MKEISNAVTTVNAEVLTALRYAVVNGELSPGSLHSVRTLATQLGVSRTPVREALIKMAEQRMVRFERNRGVRILQTTSQDLQEVFELRLLLEVPATRRACERFDVVGLKELRRYCEDMGHAARSGDEFRVAKCCRHFHALILTTSGNGRLAEIVDEMCDMVLKHGAASAEPSRCLQDIVAEYIGVLERLEACDSDGSANAMRAHLQNTAALHLTQDAGRGIMSDLNDGALAANGPIRRGNSRDIAVNPAIRGPAGIYVATADAERGLRAGDPGRSEDLAHVRQH